MKISRVERYDKLVKGQKVEISQMSYLLVVILELNSISEIQYKKIMMIDNK